jgi:hypothetical protein
LTPTSSEFTKKKKLKSHKKLRKNKRSLDGDGGGDEKRNEFEAFSSLSE